MGSESVKLESANGGNYAGLFGEIVILDDYRIKKIPFVPDTIIDLGANVGVFTRYCRGLFPNAMIIAVEPDAENFEYLKIGNDHPSTTLLNKAIGSGGVYRIPSALNGAHECYLSEGIGYSLDDLNTMNKVAVLSIMLPDLSMRINGKVLLKVDIEGNDTVIMNDPVSVNLIKTFDYVVFEIHNFAHTEEKRTAVINETNKFIEALSETHDVIRDASYLYATHKKYTKS